MKEEVAPESTKADTCGMSSRIRMMSTYWVKVRLGPTAEQEPLQRWCCVRSSHTVPTMTGCSCFQLLGSFHNLYLKFDKLLKALTSYMPWVATVKT
jgi:hypothetical protein